MTDQPTPDAPCGICDHPHQNHRTRYTAGHGNHEWTSPKGNPFRTYTEINDALDRTLGSDRPRHRPHIVPHPAGGVTLAWRPEDTTPQHHIISRTINTRSTT